MNPKQKMITVIWCSITMLVTVVLSHGHLVIRELMRHWPTSDSWETRFETALYTQGGLVFLSSLVIGAVMFVRGYLGHIADEKRERQERAQRERHERAGEQRHDALMESLARLAGGAASKKSEPSGARPR